jgi:AcrR family transcriptional regulator
MSEIEPARGRQPRVVRNDARILESARAVFVADPGAPISAVAKHAGVGISALYRRYESKQALLHKLCWDGLSEVVALLEEALADTGDAWASYSTYVRHAADADTNSLTIALAGTFTPSAELNALAERSARLTDKLFTRTRRARVLRAGVVAHDVSLILEQVAAIRGASPDRTKQLRDRYLELMLDGLSDTSAEPLPGPAPTWTELNERWVG